MNVELFGDLAGTSVFDREIYSERGGALLDVQLPFLKETNTRLASISSFVRCCAEHKTPLITSRQGTQLMGSSTRCTALRKQESQLKCKGVIKLTDTVLKDNKLAAD